MPIVDKPQWIQHGGTSILGVDIDPSGERIATCGADNKVKVWSMRPVISEAAELDPSVPKLLAALADSITPVNCVRFSPSGRFLAAGSDDADVYVYELREGRGSATFGSGEAANVENWRLKSRLRGHVTNVGDVAWAPDSRRLATASVDNKVKVWDALSGHCIRTLEGHEGHVKGVAWDPFDFFLASQGDREAIVWRLEDGAPVARISEPFASAPIVTFTMRPAWSPDGQTLALANGMSNGAHCVPCVRRNAWTEQGEHQLCGHSGSVTVVRYAPHLTFKPPRRTPDGAAGAAAAAADADDDAVGGVIALGAMDKKFTVWHPSLDHPVMCGEGFFSRMINDLAWGPDGRVLIAASYDGSLTSIVFGPEDLGRRVPEDEVQKLLAQLYGEPSLRNQRGGGLAAAPELLQLEARARAEVEREERLNSRLGAGPSGAAGVAAAAAAAAGLRPAAAPAPRAPPVANGPPAAMAPAGPRPPLPAATAAAGPRGASPARPAAATGAGAAAGATGRAAGAAGPSGRDPEHPPAKRIAVQPISLTTGSGAGAAPVPGLSAAGRFAGAGAAPAATAGGGLGPGGGGGAAAADTAGAGAHGAPAAVLVPPDPVKPTCAILIHAQSAASGEPQVPLELQALNTNRDARGRPVAELVCLAGPVRRWSDSLPGHILAMAGSSRLAAVATTNGDLMVYSSAGRRLFPPIRLGCPAAFLHVAPHTATLLALTSDGRLRLWDFGSGECLLESSVAPLLTGGEGGGGQQQPLRVAAARISSCGSPLVVLSNAYAYVHHAGLRVWMRVADDAFPASAYTTNLTSAATGELSRLQAASAQRRHPADVLAAAAAAAARPAAGARSEAAVLEHNLAAAAALQSPAEWRLWLVTYVRRLTADGDEARLRDLISELLGPQRWAPPTHASGPAAAASAAAAPGAAPARAGGAGEPPPLGSSVAGGSRWTPSILGFDKRRLLREVVLREVAKNRAHQQLVAEVLDQLKHMPGEGAAGQPARQPGGAPAASGANGQQAAPEAGAGAPQARGLQAPPQAQQQPMVVG